MRMDSAWGGRRLENGSPRTGDESDEPWSERRNVLHGGLHVPREKWRAGAGCAHARGMSVDRRRQASAEIHLFLLAGKQTRQTVFAASTGSAVNASVVEMGSRFRLIVNR